MQRRENEEKVCGPFRNRFSCWIKLPIPYWAGEVFTFTEDFSGWKLVDIISGLSVEGKTP